MNRRVGIANTNDEGENEGNAEDPTEAFHLPGIVSGAQCLNDCLTLTGGRKGAVQEP